MNNFKAERKVLDYVKKDFDNLFIQIDSEDEKFINYYFDITDLLTVDDIKTEPDYKPKQNNYPVYKSTGERKLNQIQSILDNSNIDVVNKENLLFMLLYIKVGIDIHPQWQLVNYVHSANNWQLYRS